MQQLLEIYMDLSKVVNISGKSGLFQIVAQSANRIIVESLDTGKRVPVFARDNFSILKDISVFTYEDNIALEEVLVKIYEAEDGKKTMDSATATVDELKAKMEELVPTYDKDNVYPSDMKKLFKWYNILIEKKLWTPADVEGENSEDDKSAKDTKKAAPKAKKATPKNAGKTSTKAPKGNASNKGKVKK
ncbi:MAG: hypothetical protein ACI8XB_001414 [Patiriisocius sp.]